VAATDALDNYAGGVLDEDPADGIENREINHVVSIVGWGTSEQQVPYWIARNSWGEHWGEMGFFRVRRGNNSFALESEPMPHTLPAPSAPSCRTRPSPRAEATRERSGRAAQCPQPHEPHGSGQGSRTGARPDALAHDWCAHRVHPRSECVFAIPGDFTVSNHPCSEDSANCGNHNLNKVNGCLGGHGMAGQGQGAAKADKRKRSTTTATALDAEATGKPTGLLLPFQAVSGSS